MSWDIEGKGIRQINSNDPKCGIGAGVSGQRESGGRIRAAVLSPDTISEDTTKKVFEDISKSI